MKTQWTLGLMASCLAMAGVSARAESPIASLESSFTDFKYELRSLDAQAATAPTVTFQAVTFQNEPVLAFNPIDKVFGVARTDVNGNLSEENELVAGTPWAMASARTSTIDGTLSASVTPSGLFASGAFDAAYAASQWGSSDFNNGNIVHAVKAGMVSDVDAVTFTLSAHSSITFTGLLKASLSLDTTALNQLAPAFYDGIRTPYVSADAANYVQVIALPEDPTNTLDWQQQEDVLAVSESYNHLPGVAGSLVVKSDEKVFSLTVENTRDTAMQGVFSLFTAVDTSWYRNTIVSPEIGGPITTTTTNVPEPSTYVLMGLGLVGLSVVARQRRTKPAH